jgi:hypothetical protein
MTIKQLVEFSQDVDVHVSLDDLKGYFDASDPTTVNGAKALLNSAYKALSAMSAKLIAEMTPEVRKIVVDSFTKELERYR